MTNSNTPIKERPPFPKIRSVSMMRPFHWLNMAWVDMKSCPAASLFYGFCFIAGGGLMTLSLRSAPEYIAAVTAGFLIVGSFLAMGLYEISRRRELGLPCNLVATLTP